MRPSKKAVQRQKDALRDLTGPRHRTVPVSELIGTSNRQLRGWGNYFGRSSWKDAFHEINGHVQTRLKTHLRHRSQRPFRVPEGQTLHHHLQTLGLVQLRGNVSA
jgi:RNA-directed DNA polymerase